jgi:hypothetical protein
MRGCARTADELRAARDGLRTTAEEARRSRISQVVAYVQRRLNLRHSMGAIAEVSKEQWRRGPHGSRRMGKCGTNAQSTRALHREEGGAVGGCGSRATAGQSSGEQLYRRSVRSSLQGLVLPAESLLSAAGSLTQYGCHARASIAAGPGGRGHAALSLRARQRDGCGRAGVWVGNWNVI